MCSTGVLCTKLLYGGYIPMAHHPGTGFHMGVHMTHVLHPIQVYGTRISYHDFVNLSCILVIDLSDPETSWTANLGRVPWPVLTAYNHHSPKPHLTQVISVNLGLVWTTTLPAICAGLQYVCKALRAFINMLRV